MSLYIKSLGKNSSPQPSSKVVSGIFQPRVNEGFHVYCGFRPKAIMILMGVIPPPNNANLRGGIFIDENGKWSDIHTNTTGASSYTADRSSPAMQTTFSIDDTGFSISNSNANFCSRKWAYIALSEPISEE